MMSNLLVITGAGASYDVISLDNATVPIDTRYQPPLTRGLFKLEEKFSYDDHYYSYIPECLSQNQTAAQVGYALQQKEGDGEIALEKYLLDLKNNAKISIRNQFWSIPLYLNELFTTITENYIKTTSHIPSNYKLLIDKIIEHSYDKLIWMNLNYDCFADSAIEVSVKRPPQEINDYTRLNTEDGLEIKYTKPHGSIDWWRAIPTRSIQRNMFKWPLNLPDNAESLLTKKIYTTQQLVHEFGQEWNLFSYPAISAPIGEYEFVCSDHVEQIKPFLNETHSVLCIGFSALDADILNLLKENMNEIKKLRIVNGSTEDGEKAYNRLDTALNIKKQVTKNAALSDTGFSDFMKKEIDEWLQ